MMEKALLVKKEKMTVIRVLQSKSKKFQSNKCEHQDLQIHIQVFKQLSNKIKQISMVKLIANKL